MVGATKRTKLNQNVRTTEEYKCTCNYCWKIQKNNYYIKYNRDIIVFKQNNIIYSRAVYLKSQTKVCIFVTVLCVRRRYCVAGDATQITMMMMMTVKCKVY